MNPTMALNAFGDISNWGTSNGAWPLNVNIQINYAIPEPSTYALILGGIGLGFVVLKRRKRKEF
ncbi:MAG: PEP-CTERM sorting domain-containing protein [Verrucomicrobia bacterium]|nr:PEP-CTERM sorting domain-containing protein [Verrucomicrobiota bacterium]MDA1068665.1 PEP-CTERM sorting domain-containing protein [Verrucomicrobiota bacterium]